MTMIEPAGNTFSFADFELNAAKRLLRKGGQPVALNPKAFDLLFVLIENRGQIVDKERLFEKVWANQFVEENNLTVHISTLRKIFGEKKGEHQFIITIPGKGYKFVADDRRTVNNSLAEINGAALQKPAPDIGDAPDVVIGRAREIAEIKRLLRQQNKCLITLTGAGGSGKTKLARTIADELQTEFADGVFFVELAAFNRAELVIGAIAQVLDVKELSEKSLFDVLKDFCGSAKFC